MKVIKRISVLLLAVALLTPLVGCGSYYYIKNSENNPKNNLEESTENSTENYLEENTENGNGNYLEENTENSTGNAPENDMTLWFTTIEKTEPKDGLEYIFDKQFTLPIDFSKIEADEQYYEDIKEALTSKDLVTQGYDINPENDKYKPTIRVKNYSDAILSVADCYEDNQWLIYSYIDTEKGNLNGVFQPDIADKPRYDYKEKTSPLLNAIVQKIGSPTVYLKKRANENSTSVDYTLIWQNDEYTLEIGVNEVYLQESDTQDLFIEDVVYYTPEVWAYEKINYVNPFCEEYVIQ